MHLRMDGNRVCRPEIGEQKAEISTPHRNIANTHAIRCSVGAVAAGGAVQRGAATFVATTAPIGDYGKPTHLWHLSLDVSKHLPAVRHPFCNSALEPAEVGAQRACLRTQPTAMELRTPNIPGRPISRFDADRAEAIAKPNQRLEESPYAQR